MDEKRFSKIIRIAFGERILDIGSAGEASKILMSTDWPERGERHRDAVDACLKVLEGTRSTADAETAFVEAAREAGVLQPD